MHYCTYLVFIATSSLAKAAELSNTNFTSVSAGILFTITWLDASGPVTLKLKNGPATALQDVVTIGSGLTGTSFSWTPAGTFSSGPYALEIVDSTGPNYSVQFYIAGPSASSAVPSDTFAASSALSSVAVHSGAAISSAITPDLFSDLSTPYLTTSGQVSPTLSAVSGLSSNPPSSTGDSTAFSTLVRNSGTGSGLATTSVASRTSGPRTASATTSATNAAAWKVVRGFNLLAAMFAGIVVVAGGV